MSFTIEPTWNETLKIIMRDTHNGGDIPKNMQALKKATPQQLRSFVSYRHGISNPANGMLNYMQLFQNCYTGLLIIDDAVTGEIFLETLSGKRLMKFERLWAGNDTVGDPIMNSNDSIIINLSQHPLKLSRWGLFKLSVITGFLSSVNKSRKRKAK